MADRVWKGLLGNPNHFRKIEKRQAGAELGQAQVIIEVLVEVGVTLMLKL